MRFSILLLFLGMLGVTGCRPEKPAVPGRLDPPVSCTTQPEYLFSGGKIRVVGVFTTWSLKSQAQWSRFLKVAPRFAQKHVSFIAVFTDPDQRVVDEWVLAEKPPFRVVHDPRFGMCGRHVREVPVTFILDARNRILTFTSGHVTSDTLDAQVRDALSRTR
jgi:hypothetical protein